jgi:plastocyanin
VSRRRRAAAAVLAAAASLATLPALALGGAHAAGTHVVPLKEFRFHPRTLTINRGESVKWVWEDEIEHNVTFHSFHSRTQIHGTYTVRFNRRGTFSYECTIHAEEGMRGRIVVR